MSDETTPIEVPTNISTEEYEALIDQRGIRTKLDENKEQYVQNVLNLFKSNGFQVDDNASPEEQNMAILEFCQSESFTEEVSESWRALAEESKRKTLEIFAAVGVTFVQPESNSQSCGNGGCSNCGCG